MYYFIVYRPALSFVEYPNYTVVLNILFLACGTPYKMLDCAVLSNTNFYTLATGQMQIAQQALYSSTGFLCLEDLI